MTKEKIRPNSGNEKRDDSLRHSDRPLPNDGTRTFSNDDRDRSRNTIKYEDTNSDNDQHFKKPPKK